ncbi:hypothetical protein DRW03_09645 [Corallococcus sp. H22C18031201]|uniref:hypothetical protein n=1 Tax=Citreicoccus inhibens TaxID=2849499 RepID=UPI000E7304FF|nr:hypothetical protein [Citreicoccus inhibens]MBU8895881.1 hypothetical protein [Citreicoccus inhibens]RJS23885.1 hypothetical protein DRW03_09645 [Corallococcus sp. H22C18031201]
MKKVLIGVGIGCGALLILGLMAGIGLFLVGKKAVESSNLGTAAARFQKQEEALTHLQTTYAFTAPPDGQVLKLDAARLEAYLAVREGALPAYAAFAEKSHELEAKRDQGHRPGVTELLQAANAMSGLVADCREAYVSGLTKQKMSPAEFTTITQALYVSTLVTAMGTAQEEAARQGRAALEKQVAKLDQDLAGDSLTGAARTQAEQLRAGLQEQLDDLHEAQENGASPEQRATMAANLALMKPMEARIAKVANPAFDLFTANGAGAMPGSGSEEATEADSDDSDDDSTAEHKE